MKKYKLYFVEGPSDQVSLRRYFEHLYEEIDPNIKCELRILKEKNNPKEGGDITSLGYKDEKGNIQWVTPKNIIEKIDSLFIDRFLQESKLRLSDIDEIVQIVDTDGTFIDDMAVKEDKSMNKEESPEYKNDYIRCINIDHIIDRNKHKKENIEYLVSCNDVNIRGSLIPYSIYYFSVNIDHCLHNAPNTDWRNKRGLAEGVGSLNGKDPNDRINQLFYNKSYALLDYDYQTSWDFIKEGNNSLHRHTNINVLFDILREQARKK